MNAISKPNILVADTDPQALGQIVELLAPASFQVFTAICRESALSAARAIPLDLVIADLNLNLSESPQLIEAIHAIPDRSDVPAIFTSLNQAPDVIRRQHDFGGAFHIKKPCDPAVLTTLIDRALWMPHLIETHIRRPHFNIGAAAGSISNPVSESTSATS